MERLTQQELQALLEFVRDCYAWRNREAFVTHLLKTLPTLVPADIISCTELSLSERQGRLRLIEPVDAATCEDPRIFEAHAGEQPLVAFYLRSGNGGAYKNSDFFTRRQFHRTALYNEFYRRVGMEHTAAIHLGPSPLIIGVTVHRALTDFSECGRLLLNLLRPHLVQAYANAEAVTRIQQDAALLRRVVTAQAQEIVILTPDGRVRVMTQQARTWLSRYFSEPARSAVYLPDTVERWRRRQDALLTGTSDAPALRIPMVVERDSAQLTIRHLCGADQCLLHLEERHTAAVPAPFGPSGLTRRESQVLRWVAQGKTNAEVGAILGLSSRTVQAHLRRIFEKLGVETRIAAVIVALGWHSGE